MREPVPLVLASVFHVGGKFVVNSMMLVIPAALFQEISSPPETGWIATCKSVMSMKTKLAVFGGKLEDNTGNVFNGGA